MKNRSFHFVLLLALLLSSSLAYAQGVAQAGNKKPRSLDDYQPRTLKEIFAMKPDPQDLLDKQGQTSQKIPPIQAG